jgi:hypothetical protein
MSKSSKSSLFNNQQSLVTGAESTERNTKDTVKKSESKVDRRRFLKGPDAAARAKGRATVARNRALKRLATGVATAENNANISSSAAARAKPLNKITKKPKKGSTIGEGNENNVDLSNVDSAQCGVCGNEDDTNAGSMNKVTT